MYKAASILAVLALAACTTAPPTPEAAVAEHQLNSLLAGKVAGAPTECIPTFQSNSASLIAPGAVAFVPNPGKIYVSNITGSGCEGLANPRYSLVSTSHGSSLCRGDIVQVRDLQTGVMVGACSLGAFTPYARPGA
ncbi:MAG TPA: hypothetical protein VID20_07310 [Sphingomicrobium sp.]|jgi:hypothetical protein